jgi:hypothetical protein
MHNPRVIWVILNLKLGVAHRDATRWTTETNASETLT